MGSELGRKQQEDAESNDGGASEPLQAGQIVGNQTNAPSLSSLRCQGGTALNRKDTSAVLAALVAMEQRQGRLEQLCAGSSRRWLALEDELQRLREEESGDKARVRAMQQEHTEAVRAIQGQLTGLQQEQAKACDMNGSDFLGSRCASLLQEQVKELESEWLQLEARVTEAAAKAEQIRNQGKAAQAQADLVQKLWAEAEEAADHDVDMRRTGRSRRVELLEGANRALHRKLEHVEQRRTELRTQIQLARKK